MDKTEDTKSQIENLRRAMGTLPSQSPELKTEFKRGVEGITVKLIDRPVNPYKSMVTLATTCWGEKVDKWPDLTPENRFKVLKAVLERQALPLALESSSYVFAIEGPSRAAFDQLARTRIGAVFSAAGMRDNNWKDASIRIPSSRWPSESEFARCEMLSTEDPSRYSEEDRAVLQKVVLFNSMVNSLLTSKQAYADIVDTGTASWQSARTVLPLYVCYRWSVAYNFSALLGVCANREKFCLTADNLIQTSEGSLKRIADIVPGDRVLTEKGIFKPVKITSERPYTGRLYKFLTYGTPECMPLEVTTGHKIMAVDTSKFRGNDGVVRKPLYDQALMPEWVESQNLKCGDLIAYPIITEEREVKILGQVFGKDLAELVGYYIAEGWSTGKQIILSFGPDELNLAERTKELFEKLFSVKAYIRDRTTGEYKKMTNTYVVEVSSTKLSESFLNLFGHTAMNKHLPEELLYAPKEILSKLYTSYKAGDGSTITVNKGGEDITYDSFTTVSSALAIQIKNLSLKLGKVPSISKAKYDNTCIVLGREVNQHSKYIVTVFDEKKGSKGRRSFKSADGNYQLYLIKSIAESEAETLVYNMTVDEIHSYTTAGQLVSNCEMEDTCATAWLMREAIKKEFPLLASYLRPRCDNVHQCQYHKSYTMSEMFGCLFKECGRNPCSASDGYAEFNETCTDRNLLIEQLHIDIPTPQNWVKYDSFEDLEESDKALLRAD